MRTNDYNSRYHVRMLNRTTIPTAGILALMLATSSHAQEATRAAQDAEQGDTQGAAPAIQWRGLLDVRAVDTALYPDGQRSFINGGLGKTRYDTTSRHFSLGQAVLRADADLLDAVTATVELSADGQHNGVIDVREAWLGWNPLPDGPWKNRVKAGFFFPPTSVEIDYDGIGWTPTRTISSSAINSWIGEELRTNGVEWSALHRGRYASQAYDYGFAAAVFTGNDPTGTMLAWRGWSISDRIAGRNEALQLADLPVYRADGAIPRQDRTIHPFREVDGKLGYYLGANYNYGKWLELAVLRYDNRADPIIVKNGQYGWHTRFDHASAVLRPGGEWEVLMQAMRGDTLMGRNAVALDFQSWYALLSHPLGSGSLALRYDRFSTSEHDILPGDPNNETGHGWALAYKLPLTDSLELMAEALAVSSVRSAREQIGEAPALTERSLTASLRWRF